jgi:hypothetical protein
VDYSELKYHVAFVEDVLKMIVLTRTKSR